MPMNREHKRQNTQGAEAGFTLIELILVIVLASILGTFVFSIITKSLTAQINMRDDQRMAEDAVRILDKICTELREAKTIHSTGTDVLIFEKKITSSTDTNLFIQYYREAAPNNKMRRKSATTLAGLPSVTMGEIFAQKVTFFETSQHTQYSSTLKTVKIQLHFENGSQWRTKVAPMNYGL